MNKILSFVTFTYCATTPLLATTSLSEPYTSVELLPEYLFGYYRNASQINNLFKKHDIRVVVEVGSWIGGGSTRHIANLLKPKGGLLYAVDTWLGSSTQQLHERHYQAILPLVYEQFLSNMIHWDLTQTVIPIRMDSLSAAKAVTVQPDLIYIDGEHTYSAVYADLCAWYPFVADGGILCGDDWLWTSVQKAVNQFAKEQGKTVEASGNFWCLVDQ